jgi:CBS domain-containing protein
MTKFRCLACGFIVERATKPEQCPECDNAVFLEVQPGAFQRLVRDVMRPQVHAIAETASVWEAAQRMRRRRVGSLIVMRRSKPVGIVTERDILYKVVAKNERADKLAVGRIMSSPVVSVESTTTVREALEMMLARNFRRLLVTQRGRPVGLVAQKFIIGDELGRARPDVGIE